MKPSERWETAGMAFWLLHVAFLIAGWDEYWRIIGSALEHGPAGWALATWIISLGCSQFEARMLRRGR